MKNVAGLLCCLVFSAGLVRAAVEPTADEIMGWLQGNFSLTHVAKSHRDKPDQWKRGQELIEASLAGSQLHLVWISWGIQREPGSLNEGYNLHACDLPLPALSPEIEIKSSAEKWPASAKWSPDSWVLTVHSTMDSSPVAAVTHGYYRYRRENGEVSLDRLKGSEPVETLVLADSGFPSADRNPAGIGRWIAQRNGVDDVVERTSSREFELEVPDEASARRLAKALASLIKLSGGKEDLF